MSRVSRLALVTLFAFLFAVACGGGSDDPEGGTDMDGGGGGDCTSMDDGAACGSGLICLSEVCVASECGDGYVDEAAGEECDDGNDMAFDGCEPDTCAFTCTDDAQCDDGRECNGVETCTDNLCTPGSPPGDGAECELDGGGDGVCRGDACVSAGCGNGVVDGGEDCDDGNEMDRDGCDVDCTFSCTMEGTEECSDGDVCNGEETCDVATNACVDGEPLDCDDGDECTMNECDPTDGCMNPLIDEDGDGHAPDSLSCGDDCDDGDPDRFEGAEELCDGIDNDCNGIMDDGAPTWYVDCDGDGFAVDTTGATPEPSCDPPSSPPAGCSGGGWTSVRPTSLENTDCNDGNDDVFPGQTTYFESPIPGEPAATDYDYDCDGVESKELFCAILACSTPSCAGTGFTEGCTSDCSGTFCRIGIPPDCGEGPYDYRSCSSFRSSCLSFSSTQTQACR
ncbi:MAG TPA: MopE-related protein [Sandaracinaceae bacterium LLY-WYZ-13_1]|nr:MopE-related protein [Sandaracinaceae bacterium LLY-WYZ-13_1]